MLNVVMLIVTAQSVGMLKDVMPIVNALSVFGAVGCESRAQYYKKIYGRKSRLFIISQSVCPWQAFPAYSNFFQVRPEPTRLKPLLGASL
jgi:hypothetical protein